MRSEVRLAALIACLACLMSYSCAFATKPVDAPTEQIALSVSPSSAVIKVGGNATISLTVSSILTSQSVCFNEQGFPSSGFVLIFDPQCAALQDGIVKSQLTVEATPAAAPQNFTAYILATVANVTASAPLTITVIPAISPWIPWTGIVIFFLVIGAALFIKPRKSKSKGKMKES